MSESSPTSAPAEQPASSPAADREIKRLDLKAILRPIPPNELEAP